MFYYEGSLHTFNICSGYSYSTIDVLKVLCSELKVESPKVLSVPASRSNDFDVFLDGNLFATEVKAINWLDLARGVRKWLNSLTD